MQDKTSLTLQQKVKGNEERHFELKAGRELHVVHRKGNNRTKYAFSILALHDKARRIYHYQKRWLVLSVLMMVLMALVPIGQPYLPAPLAPYGLYLLAGLFFLAMLFCLLWVQTFHRRDVFYSVYTNLPLVEFWINKPSRHEYQAFISALENQIVQHRQEMNIAYEKQLAGELRTLRRVTEAGLLSESVYIAAKAKLLLLSDTFYQPEENKD